MNEVQRNLGVLLLETQKYSRQMQQVVRKANGILSFLARIWNLEIEKNYNIYTG